MMKTGECVKKRNREEVPNNGAMEVNDQRSSEQGTPFCKRKGASWRKNEPQVTGGWEVVRGAKTKDKGCGEQTSH